MNSLLQERLFVSRAVLRGLEAVAAMQSAQTDDGRPLTAGIDQIANEVLANWLSEQPGLAEREAKIRSFFRSLNEL